MKQNDKDKTKKYLINDDNSIVISNGVKEVSSNFFVDLSSSFKKITFPNSLKIINDEALMNWGNLEEVKLPSNLKRIENGAFKYCKLLKHIVLPKKLSFIASNAFLGCKSLKEIDIPHGVDFLSDRTFYGCTSLSKVNFSSSIKSISNLCFCENYGLKQIILPHKLKNLYFGCFKDCKNLKEVQFNKCLEYIDNFVFSGCEGLEEVFIPKSVREISGRAFENCKNIAFLHISNSKVNVFDEAFYGCEFNHFYKLKKNEGYILSKTEIDCEFDSHIDVSFITKNIIDFDYSCLFNETKIEKIIKVCKKLNRTKLKIPFEFFERLDEENLFDTFINECEFRFFESEFLNINGNILQEIHDKNYYETLLKFAYSLGCFSTRKMLDKNGFETQAYVGQYASALLANILKNSNIDMLDRACRRINYYGAHNQELLKFLFHKDNEKNLDNVRMILNLEVKYPCVLDKALNDFNFVKLAKQTPIYEGEKKRACSWQEAFISSLQYNQFKNVSKENEDIAIVYAPIAKQEAFDMMCEAREYVKKHKTPHHLLGKPLKEETIVEVIERIKGSTKKVLLDAKQLVDDLYEKRFTYEFLDKHDMINGVIGHSSMTDCCSCLDSPHYGSKIALATIISNDVQNIDIRDAKGAIIAKSAFYLNREKGYMVLNSLQVNSKYHKRTTILEADNPHNDLKIENDRNLIFNALLRGVYDFVKAYDKKHPKNPITKVNIGKKEYAFSNQLFQFEIEKQILKVPKNYKFLDAAFEQRILYKREDGISKRTLREGDDNGNA